MKLLTFLLAFLILINTASASFITLSTTISEIRIENSAQANIKLVNSGDEPALNLHISLILPEGFESDEINLDKLNPNATFEGIINITRTKELLAGRYPATVLTEYTDINGYLFSSISPASIVYKASTNSKVTGSISELRLGASGSENLILDIKNLDEIRHEIKVKLFLPRELKTNDYEKTVAVNAKEKYQMEFSVSNLAALKGSAYVILTSLEYDYNNMHYSSQATAVAKVGDATIPQNFPWIHISIFLLIVIFIYFQIKSKAGRK
ncbi:MAG: hypothetical protein HY361_02645 [Candidatus Aenigmarchaeota archaeon]|nr:hypothetical protein [Candidatus Aenigmarchaeota archaeon]